MKSKLIRCFCVALLGGFITLPMPAMAFRGGGGFGGARGGGGMHFGGSRGIATGRSVFVPGANRFAVGPFARNRFNTFAFRERFFHGRRHVRGVVFAGALGWPYFYDFGYDDCWQQLWTGYGWQWVNGCSGYGF